MHYTGNITLSFTAGMRKAEAKKEARYEIEKDKLQCKNRAEEKFHSNDLKAVWAGMTAMTSQSNKRNRWIHVDGFESHPELANALNEFLSTF